jgi:hypothetical protein
MFPFISPSLAGSSRRRHRRQPREQHIVLHVETGQEHLTVIELVVFAAQNKRTSMLIRSR